jgi:hypothetical protein
MGFLKTAVDIASQKKRDEAFMKMNALQAVLGMPGLKDSEREFHTEELMKVAGMKGPAKELFTTLLGKVGKGKQQQGEPHAPEPGPGVPGGQTGFSREQKTGSDGLPETRVKPEMSAGEAPSTGMFYSTGEQQEMLRQKEETQKRQQLDFYAKQLDLQGQANLKAAQATHDQAQSTFDALLQSGAIDMKTHGEYTRQNALHLAGVKEPATPAAEMKAHRIKKADGTVVTGYETSTQGDYYIPGQGVYHSTATDEIDPKTEKPDELTGEPKSYEWAVKKKDDPKASPEEKKTADAIIKKWNQEDKGRDVRITVEQGAAAANAPVGPVAASSSPNQKPIERLDKNQKSLVTFTENYLSGVLGAGLGMGIAARERASKGMDLIRQLTGLPQTELDARSEVRKSDKKSFDRLNLITQGNASLENALALHGDVLINLRPSLPQSDVAKINEWLMSGSRSFNVTGVSDKAIRYGLAMAAVRNEYARVISGGGMSIAQVPVEALNSAGALMREGFNTGNTAAMVGQMKTETKLKTKGYSEQLRSLRSKIAQPLIPELYGQKYEDIVGSNDSGGGQQGGGGGGGRGGTQQGSRPPLSSFEKK